MDSINTEDIYDLDINSSFSNGVLQELEYNSPEFGLIRAEYSKNMFQIKLYDFGSTLEHIYSKETLEPDNEPRLPFPGYPENPRDPDKTKHHENLRREYNIVDEIESMLKQKSQERKNSIESNIVGNLEK